MKREKLSRIIKTNYLFRIAVGLPAGIFLAEVIAMIVVYFVQGEYWLAILVDGLITTGLMLPLIYVLSFRPLLINIAELERAEDLIRFRLNLIQFSASHTLNNLIQKSLDEIESLTGTTVGLFHFLRADQKTLWLQTWSTNTIEKMCHLEGSTGHHDLGQAGIWADCIRLRRPVVHNDYALLPNPILLPDGHAPLIRDLTVPILREGQVVAVFGIGNKPQEFTSEDVDLVSTLADFAWDIIERKRVEDALHDSEEKFRTLADWTYDWELWVDSEGDYVYISPSCERASGYLPEDFISDPSLARRIIHPDDRDLFDKHMQLIHDETAGVSNVEYRIIARDGSEHWIDHLCRPLFGKDNRYLGRRVSNRDITMRKQAELEILERHEKENKLTQAIHTLQLEIARDLHDTIGQSIGYLRMKLDHFSETDLNTGLNLKTEITNMLEVANESYDMIRGTLDVLQSGGLVDPLSMFTQYANQIEERSPLKIVVSSQGNPLKLSPQQVRQMFFVFREALSNIEHHSQADNVSVVLKWTDEHLCMLIADDGRGFHPEESLPGAHYGLKFMQERIESINGNFSLQSVIAKGTTITITLPWPQRENA